MTTIRDTSAPAANEGTMSGVALRDWFAGQALVGLIPAPARPGVSRLTTDGMAAAAYEYADAMMKLRTKP